MTRYPASFIFFVIGLMAAVGYTPLCAQETTADKAKDYFDQGAYEQALTIWYDMVASGNTSAGLYYNIGLAESGLNHTGKAMLAYEQALRINPGNRAIQKAISLERENILNATIPIPSFFLKVWYRQLVMLFRPGVWALLGLAVLVFLLFRFFMLQKRNPVEWKNQVAGMRYGMAGAILLLLMASMSSIELQRGNEAIIGRPCAFHQAPSADSPVISDIGEGEKVLIADQIGDWFNVYLLNQDAGWVRSECLVYIRIGQ
jgi:tetratricopeptide (TPR) repeat protein